MFELFWLAMQAKTEAAVLGRPDRGAFVSLIGWTMIFYLYGNMHVQCYVYCRVNIHARYYYYKINPILFKINSHKRPSEDTDGLFFMKKRIVYTEKDEPQPQVVSAFGLRMTN